MPRRASQETEEDHPPADFQAGRTLAPPSRYEKDRRELFPYQKTAVSKLKEWYQTEGARGVLCLPTGAGKTRTTVDFLLSHVVRKDAWVVWLTHRDELIAQTVRTFASRAHIASFDPRFGTYGGQKETRGKIRCHVLVASVATLARGTHIRDIISRQQPCGPIALVVVDECHHASAPTWEDVIEKLVPPRSGARLLGLSATPSAYTDEKTQHLWSIFNNKMVHEEHATELMKPPGYLATPTFCIAEGGYYRASDAELKELKTSGELPSPLITKISDDRSRTALVARTYVERRETWGKTLIFVGRINQAKELAEFLRGEKIRVDVIHGTNAATKKERKIALKNFERSGPSVLINVDILTEGTDLPTVETVFIARPTRSHVLFQQMIGRGLRGPAVKGTERCNIVAFNDDIRDMAGAFLAQDHSWMAAHYEMLGFGAPELLIPAVKTQALSQDGTSLAAVYAQARAKYAAALGALGLKEVLLDETRLLGWWTARTLERSIAPAQRRVLPHLSGDDAFFEAMKQRLSEGFARRQLGQAPWSRWVSDGLIERFFQHAQDGVLSVDYQGMSDSLPSEVWKFFGDIASQERVIPQKPKRTISRKPGSRESRAARRALSKSMGAAVWVDGWNMSDEVDGTDVSEAYQEGERELASLLGQGFAVSAGHSSSNPDVVALAKRFPAFIRSTTFDRKVLCRNGGNIVLGAVAHAIRIRHADGCLKDTMVQGLRREVVAEICARLRDEGIQALVAMNDEEKAVDRLARAVLERIDLSRRWYRLSRPLCE